MKNLAILPARGGSKSIPKKNITNLNGRPLISYSLGAVKKSKYVGRIVVSTDDEEIARVAREYGAETPFMRPKEFSGDLASGISVISHALRWLEGKENYKPEYVLFIQPTSPFVRTDQINKLFEMILEKKADSGITMVEVPRVFHPYHIRKLTPEGFLEFDNEEMHYKHPARQMDPKRFAFGSIYWFKRDAFLRENKLEAGKRVGMLIDNLSAFDINDPGDLEIAKVLIKKLT